LLRYLLKLRNLLTTER